jgi:Transcription factor PAP1
MNRIPLLSLEWLANKTRRDKLQDMRDFKDGNLDIDGLCSELRAKARCSESGVVIDQKDVDAALKRLPAKRTNSNNSQSQA